MSEFAQLPVYGATGWQMTELDDGMLKLERRSQAPLGSLLSGWSEQLAGRLKAELNLTGDGRREFFAVPADAELLRGLIRQLSDGHDDGFGVGLYDLLWFTAEEQGKDAAAWMRELHERAGAPGGADLEPARLRQLTGRSHRILFGQAARERAAGDGCDLMTAAQALLCHARGPFRVRAHAETLLAQCTFDAGGGLRLPGTPQTGGLLDLIWPDLTRRVLMVNDGARFSVMEIEHGPVPDGRVQRYRLHVFAPDRGRVLELGDRAAAWAWLCGRLAGHPPEAEDTAGVSSASDFRGGLAISTERLLNGRPDLLTVNAAPCDRVLRRFLPSHTPDERANPSGAGALDFALDYEKSGLLYERAKTLDVPGRTRMDADELRLAIAEHASAERPGWWLLEQPRGCPSSHGVFVRTPVPWERDRNAPVQRDRAALESLRCHRLPGGFTHPAFAPIPARLGPRLATLETFTPVNPFTGG